MSTHPNAILLLELIPHGLSRKTLTAVLADADHQESDETVKIGEDVYHYEVMEEDYHDDWQIRSKEGNLIFFDLFTYGYGDVKPWDALAEQKKLLEEWARFMCERHHCDYKISVTANYW